MNKDVYVKGHRTANRYCFTSGIKRFILYCASFNSSVYRFTSHRV